jgi:hypothetical protein
MQRRKRFQRLLSPVPHIQTFAVHVYPDEPLSDKGYGVLINPIQTLTGSGTVRFPTIPQPQSSDGNYL